jgi:uncharacterized protein YndB with AHSA1/START domain
VPNENWVGFAKSPKPDPNLSKLSLGASIEFAAPVQKVFDLVTSAAGLSSWLHKIEKTEVQTSGKIKLADVAEELQLAVFSLVEIGRRVVINSEIFGEISFTFDKRKPVFEISFTKMVASEVRDTEQAKFDLLISNLKARVGELS